MCASACVCKSVRRTKRTKDGVIAAGANKTPASVEVKSDTSMVSHAVGVPCDTHLARDRASHH